MIDSATALIRATQQRKALRLYRSACQGKVRNRRKKAERAAARVNDILRNQGKPTNAHAYHCPHCGAWHCGKTRQPTDPPASSET